MQVKYYRLYIQRDLKNSFTLLPHYHGKIFQTDCKGVPGKANKETKEMLKTLQKHCILPADLPESTVFQLCVPGNTVSNQEICLDLMSLTNPLYSTWLVLKLTRDQPSLFVVNHLRTIGKHFQNAVFVYTLDIQAGLK